MKVLSVVCARAGSKGLKDKCIKKINGKMVVEYAIEYSLSLGEKVRTVVSTNINELIDYCRKNNVDYIRRNSELCTDESTIDGVLADAIEKRGEECDYCSIVYGNIPIRYPEIFYRAINFLVKNLDYDAVISMQNVEKFHPEWMFDFNKEVLPKEKTSHSRRQMLPQKMIHDGHTLIFKTEGFYKRYKGLLVFDKEYKYSIFGAKIKPLINNKLIIDIDTIKDLRLVESVMANFKKTFKT